jgi:hypothetical protein
VYRLLGVHWRVATALAAAAAIAHVATFARIGFDLQPAGYAALHIGCFVLGVPLVILSNTAFRDAPPNSVHRALARQVWWLVRILGAYFLISMVIFLWTTQGGEATVQNGTFVLVSHGKVLRPLTQPEYEEMRALPLRFFSAGWVAFYASLAAYSYALARVIQNSGDPNLATVPPPTAVEPASTGIGGPMAGRRLLARAIASAARPVALIVGFDVVSSAGHRPSATTVVIAAAVGLACAGAVYMRAYSESPGGESSLIGQLIREVIRRSGSTPIDGSGAPEPYVGKHVSDAELDAVKARVRARMSQKSAAPTDDHAGL